MKALKNTTEKETFFANVEYNVEILTAALIDYKAKYELESDITKKTDAMMLMLDCENKLETFTLMMD